MTKEEVKHWLEIELRMWEDECKSEHPIKEALRAVIKALEQEPCEDTISRADAKKYLAAPDANGDRVIYESDLDLLPSVQPKVKTGHWIRELIRNEKGGCIGAKMICSECGNDNRHDEYMDYCPNCGCKND